MNIKFSLFFASSLLLNSSVTLFTANTINSKNIVRNLDDKTIIKYANDTSIVSKALLLGKEKDFGTNSLLNNMYSSLSKPSINNLTTTNSANSFINSWTSNLDYESINNIQNNYQRVGAKDAIINDISKKISSYESIVNIIPTINEYFTNNKLANPSIIDFIDNALKSSKNVIPNINQYLTYFNYLPIINGVITQLNTDWDQENDFVGAIPLAKMKDYMAKKATFSQAWNITKNGNWYYVATRANNWTWNDFYQYIAGVNFNYLFKFITNKYIGNMISENVHLSSLSFDSEKFNATFMTGFNEIISNPSAWPFLINALVPIVKTKLLQLKNPTKAITNISWDNDINNKQEEQNVQLKVVLTYLQKLLSSKTELLNLITNLMHGPFGEDINVKVTFSWPISDTYWTLPEIQNKFAFVSAIRDIPEQISNLLLEQLKNIDLNSLIAKLFNITDKYLLTNPIIDLKKLINALNATFANEDFFKALELVKNIILNPDIDQTTVRTKKLLTLLGVQLQQELNFKNGSFLANLKQQLLNTSDSSFGQKIIAIFFDSKNKNGIIDNMLAEQKQLYHLQYTNFFDLDNSHFFPLSNVELQQFSHKNGSVKAVLSYKIKYGIKSYDIAFTNEKFLVTNDFKLTLFHLSTF